MKDGDVAGIAAFQKVYGLVGVKQSDAARSVIMISREGDEPKELANIPLTANTIFLRVECDFRANADIASFFYSLDGSTWTPIGKPLKMRYTLPHFMGYRFGLFAFSTKAAGGHADFDFFRVSDRISG